MKRNQLFSLLSILALVPLLNACSWGPSGANGWKGILPDKDAHLTGVDVTLTTPWGSQRVHIDQLDTRVDAAGTNPLPPIPPPGQQSVSVTVPLTNSASLLVVPVK